jgi:hypothetical protein
MPIRSEGLLPNGESGELSAAERSYAEALLARINTIENEWDHTAYRTRPYRGRIETKDLKWLESNMRIIQASCLYPIQKIESVFKVVSLINVVVQNMVAFAEDMQLIEELAARRANGTAKPDFLIPADLSILDEDRQYCMCCTTKFGERGEDGEPAEYAVRLPCHHSHVLGTTCMVQVFEASGLTCPWCKARFDMRNFEVEGEAVTSPWWMRMLRGE